MTTFGEAGERKIAIPSSEATVWTIANIVSENSAARFYEALLGAEKKVPHSWVPGAAVDERGDAGAGPAAPRRPRKEKKVQRRGAGLRQGQAQGSVLRVSQGAPRSV